MSDSSESTSDKISHDPSASAPRSARVAAIALVIALVFVAAVLIGAKVSMDKRTYAPQSMGTVDAPQATTPQCDRYMDALPDSVHSYKRIEIEDPAPAGAAAWAAAGMKTLTFRCGITEPTQYTSLSRLENFRGMKWLPVADDTEGSEYETWYSVSSAPLIAVTGPGDISQVVDDLSKDLATVTDVLPAPAPFPYPLSTLESQSNDKTSQQCTEFLDDLPQSFGSEEKYELMDTQNRDDAPALSKTWLQDDTHAQPIVARCGVALPESYSSGARLEQVDNVQWYLDPSKDTGSAQGIWYIVGSSQVIAVTLPTSISNTVLSSMSKSATKTLSPVGE